MASSWEFFRPLSGATTYDDRVAQTVLSAVCGVLFPNWPKAADLPEKQEVCATRLRREKVRM